MLHVFIVSSGTMKKFDMNLALKNVMELKGVIQRTLNIKVEDQVLLCSGGEELKAESRVGNYGAGTDTNPIFLFSKHTNETGIPYSHTRASSETSIEDDVKGCVNMAPSCSAATVRCTLAQRFAELSVSERKECDDLVHGQHLQQQGWAAVIANLEDAKESLIKRKAHFDEMFKKYLENRQFYQDILKTFPQDIDLLAKVPVLPKLMLGTECVEEDLKTEHTLLSWFCSEPRTVLESLAERCQKLLDELNENALIMLNEDVMKVLKMVDVPHIKEVKGIEERLFTLNKLIEDAKKLEKDQKDLANWFTQTQNRINKDPSVLPDLCGTFQNQLELMLQNHKCLREILEKCTKAKIELCDSINIRLKYICRVESQMYDLQVRFMFHEKHVKSIVNQIESFRQVHIAPQRYAQMLAEVCRRRSFSDSFIKWATELSAQALKIYEKEASIRTSFSSIESKNIVDNLFPGMDDLPPPFAIECPPPFDQHLPHIVGEDLVFLRTQFPELSEFCKILLPEPIPCVSQNESDSAFGSNIRPSKETEDLTAGSGEKPMPDKCIEDAQSSKLHSLGECNSLPSEYASLPNEMFSLTPSPFEDPMLPGSDLEITVDRTKTSQHAYHEGVGDSDIKKSCDPVEERVAAAPESDGEEFEKVDRYSTSPVDVPSRPMHSPRSSSVHHATSSSDVIKDSHLKVSRARSDGDATSPIQDRLKCTELMLTSQEFQATEYFIDDSMPSSYTESNATSPMLRGSQMVKSHHVIVAELQRQVEEKSASLTSAVSSLKNSRSNILKLHATISALQRFVQELKKSLHSDLSELRNYVKEEFHVKLVEISKIVEQISYAMIAVQQQIVLEKEEAINKAKAEAVLQENAFLHKLEVESQKLNDAEQQISHYEACIRDLSLNYDELKHEKEQLEAELNLKKELIKSMMLEQELELDCLRNQMKLNIEEKENEIFSVKEELSGKISEVDRLKFESQNIKTLVEQKVKEELDALTKEHMKIIEDKERAFLKNSDEQKQLHQQEIENLQEGLKTLQIMHSDEMQKVTKDYEAQIKEIKSEIETKSKELSNLKTELNALNVNHKSELESLRSRYRLAFSTTSLDRLPSDSSIENISLECLQKDAVDAPTREKTFSEVKETCEERKTENVEKILAEQNAKLEEALKLEREKFEKEKEQLIMKLHREHENHLENLKSQYIAENQVAFNEAISRLTKEKDTIIDELRCQISLFLVKQNAIKFQLDKYICETLENEVKERETSLSRSDSGATSCKTVPHIEISTFLENMKKKFDPHLIMPDTCDTAVLCSSSREWEMFESLKKQLKLRQDEYAYLISRLFEMKFSHSSRDHRVVCPECSLRISVLSCNVGDLVLLCYEEKHENYTVFYFGQFLHFLHSDSLSALDLKIPPGPSGKSWAIGIVIEKQFCLTKKSTNRYKVSVGTRFNRVRVKPWDHDIAQSIHRTRQRSQAESATYSTSPMDSRRLSIHSASGGEEEEVKSKQMSTSAM